MKQLKWDKDHRYTRFFKNCLDFTFYFYSIHRTLAVVFNCYCWLTMLGTWTILQSIATLPSELLLIKVSYWNGELLWHMKKKYEVNNNKAA